MVLILEGYIHDLTDLNSIGGLYPLVGFLKNRHANLRAKAADVLNTIVQNNPKSQQLVMYANGLEHLLSNFTTDLDTKVRTKSLVAISCKYYYSYPRKYSTGSRKFGCYADNIENFAKLCSSNQT